MKKSKFKIQDLKLFVPGFKAAGIACGIKKNGNKDLALIYSESPAVVAGVFTTNKIKAAPVLLDMERMKKGMCQAVIVNSGNANAFTGGQGLKDAKAMAEATEKALGIKTGLAFVASTGVIGESLPIDKIKNGISAITSQINKGVLPYAPINNWQDAVEAIMTTDAFPKIAMEKGRLGGKEITVLGIAKGAGMICPNMATMLAFIATDTAVEKKALQTALKAAVDKSFNSITVDGDTSTNDTVLLLANGIAENKRLQTPDPRLQIFQTMLEKVCMKLAHMIVKDGEGATKFLEIKVKGAKKQADAKQAAMTVANSLLVKTAFFGEDANWGRIAAALGRAGVDVKEERLSLWFDDVPVVEKGSRVKGQGARLNKIIKKKDICLTIDLGMGKGEATVWTTDLSYEYVKINAAYRT